jgi:hypothetical protein
LFSLSRCNLDNNDVELLTTIDRPISTPGAPRESVQRPSIVTVFYFEKIHTNSKHIPGQSQFLPTLSTCRTVLSILRIVSRNLTKTYIPWQCFLQTVSLPCIEHPVTTPDNAITSIFIYFYQCLRVQLSSDSGGTTVLEMPFSIMSQPRTWSTCAWPATTLAFDVRQQPFAA